jgi:hypothetical protein
MKNCDNHNRKRSWHLCQNQNLKPGVLVVWNGAVAGTRIVWDQAGRSASPAKDRKFTIDSPVASRISEIIRFDKSCQQRRAARTEIRDSDDEYKNFGQRTKLHGPTLHKRSSGHTARPHVPQTTCPKVHVVTSWNTAACPCCCYELSTSAITNISYSFLCSWCWPETN